MPGRFDTIPVIDIAPLFDGALQRPPAAEPAVGL